MPQMFPLLWLFMFGAAAIALYSVMTTVYFSEKKYLSVSSPLSTFNDHNWKW